MVLHLRFQIEVYRNLATCEEYYSTALIHLLSRSESLNAESLR